MKGHQYVGDPLGIGCRSEDLALVVFEAMIQLAI
jgi:hypothetical protein